MKNNQTLSEWFDEIAAENENDPEVLAYDLLLSITLQASERLHEMGWTQQRLADELGKSKGWISRFFHAPPNMSVGTILKIIQPLGLQLEMKLSPIEKKSGKKAAKSAHKPKAKLSYIPGKLGEKASEKSILPADVKPKKRIPTKQKAAS